jgi:DNA repair protein RecN (Recombination protein N)
MLTSLYIKNYLLIDELLIDFKDGLTTVTGETGAGKSIILGALSLILGERNSSKILLDKNNKCIVEGVFNIQNYNIEVFFENNNLDYDNNCILRREISPSGKSRAFINDTPCSLNIIKELAQNLVDLHSQFANDLVAKESFRIQLIDSFSNNNKLFDEYLIKYNTFKKLEKEVAKLQEQLNNAVKDIDYYRFQANQIEEAKIENDHEIEELESELSILENAEEIKISLSESYNIIDDDETGVIQSLKQVRNRLEKAGKHSNEISELSARIESVLIELRDIANSVDEINSTTEVDPKRLELAASRLDLINSLLNKFRLVNIAELKQVYSEILSKIGSTDELENELQNKNKDLLKKKSDLVNIAQQMSVTRKSCIGDIEKTIIKMLSGLGMPGVQLKVRITSNEEPTKHGMDSISFLFSANKNLDLQEIQDAASGGEMSRIMLCLKSLISNSEAVPTLIFDEIDTGVSGEIADSMGKIMQQMSKNQQIISITHLPQVASRGIHHYKVYKLNDDKGSVTKMKLLDKQDRINEIASMLSGEKITETAISNAKSLLEMALKF